MTVEQAIKYLQQLYPNGGHCWLDEQRIEAISMAISALEYKCTEKPGGLEEAANKYADNADYVYADVSIEDFTVETFKAGANWQKEQIMSKACEFIRTPNIYVVDFNHYGGATTNYEATVEKFKKFMED